MPLAPRIAPPRSVAVGFALALAASPASAATFCVGSTGELVSALESARANGQSDTIQVRTGTYLAPTQGFRYSSTEAHGLTVRGGYVKLWGGCAVVSDPTGTVLDGGHVSSFVLSLIHDGSGAGSAPTLRVENLTLTRGSYGGLLGVNSASGTGVKWEVLRTILAENGHQGADLYLRGSLRFDNNLVFRNPGGVGHVGGVYVGAWGSSADEIFITHNTISANGSNRDLAGGIEIDTTLPVALVNNVLWGNEAIDLVLANDASEVTLWWNDIGSRDGTGDYVSFNVDVDPLFVDPADGDFHLQDGSPVRDFGHLTPPGGLPTKDIDGEPRKAGLLPDLGADEVP